MISGCPENRSFPLITAIFRFLAPFDICSVRMYYYNVSYQYSLYNKTGNDSVNQDNLRQAEEIR
jgi:hypothetical protein